MEVLIDGILYKESTNTEPKEEDIEARCNLDFLRFLKEEIRSAKELYKSFEDDGLTINKLEAEAGYRSLLTTYNTAEMYFGVEDEQQN